jgi:hypothetical protein
VSKSRVSSRFLVVVVVVVVVVRSRVWDPGDILAAVEE